MICVCRYRKTAIIFIMNLYNNFFYLAQFTFDESANALPLPCMYGFHLYLIADTSVELERFNLPSVGLLKDDKVALHMKFKLLFDKESQKEESSIKFAGLLYKEKFDSLINSFENHPQYSRNIICKGKITTSSNLYEVMTGIRQDIRSHLSKPLALDKHATNDYHNPRQSYKNRISKHLLFVESYFESEIKRLTDANLDKSYSQNFDENTPGDIAFKKYPFCIANPKGALNNIKLRDKLDLCLPALENKKVQKI